MSGMAPLQSRIRRLLIWFASIVFLVAALLAIAIEYQKQGKQLARIMQGRVEVGRVSIQRFIQADRMQLNRFAAVLDSMHQQQAALFDQDLLLNDGQRLFYLLDTQGKVIFLPLRYRHLLGLDFSQLPHVREHKPVSEVHQSLISHRSVVSLSTRLADGGLLVMERDLASLIPRIDALSRGELLVNETLFILSRDGTVIHHPDPELVSARHNLGLEFKFIDHWNHLGLSVYQLRGETLIAYQEKLIVPDGWTVTYAVPAKLLMKSALEEIARQFLILVVIFFFLFTTLAVALNRYFSAPIKAMVKHLDEYSVHGQEVVIPTSHSRGIREFGHIIEAVNSMAVKLRHSQDELQAREKLFRTVSDYAAEWVLLLDAQARIYYISPSCRRITGYSQDEFYKDPSLLRSIIHEEDRAVWDKHRQTMSTDCAFHPFDFRIHTKSGDVRWIRHFCGQVGNYSDMGSVHRASNIDITEQKLAEQALLESNLRFTQISNSIYDVFWLGEVDDTGGYRILYVSPGFERIWQCSAEALYQNPAVWHGCIQAEDREAVLSSFRLFLQGKTEYATQFSIIRPDKTKLTLEASGNVIRDSQGKIFRAAGIVRDITERILAEEEAGKLRLLLGDIINAMPSVVAGVDRDCRVVQWNQGAEAWTGCVRESALGRGLLDLLPELDPLAGSITEAVAGGIPFQQDNVAWRKAGEARYLNISLYPLTGEGVAGAVVRLDDVTERVRIDQTMVQSEKMLSVGGLAAGMAHEINNPLAGILQNMQVLRNRLLEDLAPNLKAAEASGTSLEAIRRYLAARKLVEMMDAIRTSAQRAARIVDNMLSFSRKGQGYKRSENLEQLLTSTLELAANDYDLKKKYDFRNIGIEKDFCRPAPRVACEAGKIQQVILNLLKNAAQALHEVADADFSPHLRLRIDTESGQGVLEIEDNGPGIPEEIRRRVFEPFFTTKEVGVGTGLGLSVSYFIVVQDHKGSMTVDSPPGQGACFTVRLPLAETL